MSLLPRCSGGSGFGGGFSGGGFGGGGTGGLEEASGFSLPYKDGQDFSPVGGIAKHLSNQEKSRRS